MKSWLHWRKRDFCHQSSAAKFSFQVIWIHVSQLVAQVKRHRRTAFGSQMLREHPVSACYFGPWIASSQSWYHAESGCSLPRQRIPCSGEVSGLCVTSRGCVWGPHAVAAHSLDEPFSSVWCTASPRSHQVPLFKHSKVDSSADYFLTVAIRERMSSVNVVGEYSRLYVEYFHSQ